MNSSQIHLALTHVPVILSLLGVVFLATATIKKNDTITKASFYLMLFAGLFSLPVFFTGEGSEEVVEHLPGVSEAAIEKHEEIAKLAFGVVVATAIIALTGIIVYGRIKLLRLVRPLIFVLGVATAGLMIATAHLGGQVRHPEIRSGFTTQTEKSVDGDFQIKEMEDKD